MYKRQSLTFRNALICITLEKSCDGIMLAENFWIESYFKAKSAVFYHEHSIPQQSVICRFMHVAFLWCVSWIDVFTLQGENHRWLERGSSSVMGGSSLSQLTHEQHKLQAGLYHWNSANQGRENVKWRNKSWSPRVNVLRLVDSLYIACFFPFSFTFHILLYNHG